MEHSSIVLIVDDEPAGRATLEALLIPEGYHLAFAQDGYEALAQATALHPDVILLDIMMPGMDGYEVCQRLRNDPLLAEVPVLMVTALDDRDARLRGIATGADDFISKPFDRTELRLRLRTITRLNRARRLFEERRRVAWALEQSDDGYVIVEADDRMTYANARARLYLGWSPTIAASDAEGFLAVAQHQYHCEPPEAWTNWPAPSYAATPRYLVRPETPAAGAFWLQVESFQPTERTETGQVVRLRDVTARMATHRHMWTFQAALSHKLLTPLNQMLAPLSMLADDPELLASEDATFFVTSALAGAQRLHGEITKVLTYVSASTLAPVHTGYPLSQLPATVNKLCSELRLSTVQTVLPQELRPALLTLSAHAMELLLRELLENTQKFHPTHTPTVTVQIMQSDPHHVCLQVIDDGLTLSPADLAHVWTPYYQGEKQFTGEVGGMGLGLPLVAHLAWNVGGSCRLANRVSGPGVTVEVRLPLA